MKYFQNTLNGKEKSSVYLALLSHYDSSSKNYLGRYDKAIAVQKCGDEPYELAMRFAGCNLRCGTCFASGYSWPDLFRANPRVTNEKSIDDIVKDFEDIQLPSGYTSYNWFRILGGEPLLNDNYIEFLFDVLTRISKINSWKFNNGIIIQTNGIHIGKGNINILRDGLKKLNENNSSPKLAIEISIKGTNVREFELLTGVDEIISEDYFKFNINSYFILKELASEFPNLRSMIVAGCGINESYLLTEGRSNDRITIISKDNRPIYHPDYWSEEFKELYDDFTSTYSSFDSIFSRMPMYGIKDQFNYAWVKRALKQGRTVFGDKWYDKKFTPQRNTELENSFLEILDKFFLVNNQKYYSSMIK